MKKLSTRLTVYFAVAILFLSLVMGTVFFFLYRSYVIDYNKDSLAEKAENIASVVAEADVDSTGKIIMRPGSNFAGYIRMINETEESQVWLVTYSEATDRLVIIAGAEDPWSDKEVSTLPESAYKVISGALKGKTVFSENFTDAFGTPTITVCTPVVTQNGMISGAVLLHSPVSNVKSISKTAILLMVISIIIALCCALALSVTLSHRFTKPIMKMKDASIELAKHNYDVKTGIVSDDELGELAESIDTLSKRLAIADKEQTELENFRKEYVANISHELRTPITVIKSSAEALRDGVITEKNEILQYYDTVIAESDSLENMVSELLELSRLQNNTFKLDFEMFSLTEAVYDTVRKAEKLYCKKNMSIDVAVNESNPCLYNGDCFRIKGMLMILLDNAYKFSDDGSSVKVSLEDTEKEYVLTVSDKGAGISPKELPHIFERFRKNESNLNKSGSGLGLAIAKETILRHNGTVKVRSALGRGTEFRIFLPKVK